MANGLQQRLAKIAAGQPARWPRQTTYAETVLRAEMQRALSLSDAPVLRALDRIREAMGCPPDHRVTEFLQEAETHRVRS